MGNTPKQWLSILGPGVLVAATGVGALLFLLFAGWRVLRSPF